MSLQTYKMYDIMSINATLGHRAEVYFTCTKLLLWLITVSNINRINPFFSKISHQKKMYENIAIITRIWDTAKATLHALAVHGT